MPAAGESQPTEAILRGGPFDGRVERIERRPYLPPELEPCALCGHLRHEHGGWIGSEYGHLECRTCCCSEFLAETRLRADERRGHAAWAGYAASNYTDTGERDADGRAIYAYETVP